jgi:hypothetical protein
MDTQTFQFNDPERWGPEFGTDSPVRSETMFDVQSRR